VLDESPEARATDSGRETPAPGDPAGEDELSDTALDAVVGGLTTEAALARAAAFDPTLRLPTV